MRYPFLEKIINELADGDTAKLKPIIVGGMAGNGTRTAVWLLRGMNVYMGSMPMAMYAHEPFDSIPIAWFLYSFRAAWARNQGVDEHKMVQAFQATLDQHLSHWNGEKLWGWKNPSNLYLIDFYHELFPEMKYVHVVRDGRDVSDSWINQTLIHEVPFAIPEEMKKNPSPVNYMWIWNLMNERVIEYCENKLANQWILLRLEDISADPEAYGKKLQEFVGADYYRSYEAPWTISPPSTIGRHNDPEQFDPQEVLHMTTAGRKMLSRLEYIKEQEQTLVLSLEAPIVIGGFGGSGTRVPVLYLLAAGVNMLYDPEIKFDGKEVYEKLVEFGYKWADDALNFRLDEEHLQHSIATLAVDKRPWGWKNPSTVLYLEYLHKLIPNMKFIHITRDPRDISMKAMAVWVDLFADPKREVSELNFANKDELAAKGTLKYLEFWADYNEACYDYGTKNMGSNYLHVKLEELLPRNMEAFTKLAEFAGVKPIVRENKWWKKISTTHKIGTRISQRPTPECLTNIMGRLGYDL